MKILDKYMARSFLTSFIWCVFVFIIMYIIADIFSFVSDIVEYKIPAQSIIAFYF